MQDETIRKEEALAFLMQDGEMSERLRTFDWSQTSLGDPLYWPQSLCTTLGILLPAQAPMLLLWGADQLCFYNDAFRVQFDAFLNHPYAIGKPVPQVWPQIQALKKYSMPLNTSLPFLQNGNYTFSASPVFEGGLPEGVLFIGNLIAEPFATADQPPQASQQFKDLVMQAPVAIAVFRGLQFTAEIVNDAFLPLVGKTRAEFLGKPLFDTLPEARDQIEPQARELMQTGKPFVAREFEFAFTRYGKVEHGYFDFIMEPLREAGGAINGFMAVAQEVTAQVIARRRAEEAEERARLAIESAELGTVEVNLQTGEIITSQHLDDIYDIAHPQGREAYVAALHTDDLPIRQQAFERAMQDGYLAYEARVIRKDGSLRWIRAKGKIYFDQARQPLKLFAVSQDITEEKKFADELARLVTERTAALQASQQQMETAAYRLRSVFNNTQTAMFIFSPVTDETGAVVDFRFVITNPTFAAYVGQTPDVLDGALGSAWFPGYLHNGVFDMYKKTLLTGETLRQDIHYNVDGHDIFLDLMSSKLGNEVLVTFTDHTPLKRAQLQLEKYVDDLKRSNRNLEEFAYAASHDLKEPIRKIHFFTDRLKESLKNRMTADEKKTFERMEFASKRMSSLVDDLLTYSQVSIKPKAFDEIDMNELLTVVMNDLDLEIDEKKARIQVASLPRIRGHHRQLQQVFQNLIGNALKYAQPGLPPEVAIQCSKVKGANMGLHLSVSESQKLFYAITVADNGIGFDQEDAEKIFHVFTRLHGNDAYKGTGVGLSIVRKVIENHNGYITAQSKPGCGARFTLYLPHS